MDGSKAECWACLDVRGRVLVDDVQKALSFVSVVDVLEGDGYRPGFHATLLIRLGAAEEYALEAAAKHCAPLRVERVCGVYCSENCRLGGMYSTGFKVLVRGIGRLKNMFFDNVSRATGKTRSDLEAIHDPHASQRDNVDELHINFGTVKKENAAETLNSLNFEFSRLADGILADMTGAVFRAISVVAVDLQQRNRTRNITLCGTSSFSINRLELEDRAVSVKFLREFLVLHEQKLEEGAMMTTAEAVSQIIVPATKECKQSYATMVYEPGLVGRCDYFVSHAWSYPFKVLIECVLAHARAYDSEDLGLLYWIDVIGANQHDLYAPSEIPDLDKCIRSARGTLLVARPWHSPVVLTRVWCLYELLRTEHFKRSLDLGIAEGEATDVSERMVADFASISESITAINSAAAQATNPQDLVSIRAIIEASIGFHGLNTLSKDRIREWLADKALQELWKRLDHQSSADAFSVQQNISQLQHALSAKRPQAKPLTEGEGERDRKEWHATLHFANQVAQLHGNLGRLTVAKSLYETVLELQANGPLLERCHVANNLAFLLIKSRELQRAIRLLWEHLALLQPLTLELADAACTDDAAPHEPTILKWLMRNNLAMAIGADPNLQPDAFRQANEMYLGVLHARNVLYKTPDGDNCHSIATMNNLAWLLARKASSLSTCPEEKLQASHSAEELFTKVHRFRLKKLGKRHPGTVNAEQNLAQVLHRQAGKRDLACNMQCHVCEAKIENMGITNASTQRSIRILVNFLRSTPSSEEDIRVAKFWSTRLI